MTLVQGVISKRAWSTLDCLRTRDRIEWRAGTFGDASFISTELQILKVPYTSFQVRRVSKEESGGWLATAESSRPELRLNVPPHSYFLALLTCTYCGLTDVDRVYMVIAVEVCVCRPECPPKAKAWGLRPRRLKAARRSTGLIAGPGSEALIECFWGPLIF